MGNKWDYDVPSEEIWIECSRVLKHGGTMLCFAGSRTQHRMAVRIEDAGFILKDTIMWVYATGLPKGTDIGKVVPDFKGWKSHALKPSYEPILVCMKPNEGSYAENALKHGVSGLNIDSSRIGETKRYPSNFIHDGSDEVLELFPNTKSGGSFNKDDYLDNEHGVTNFIRGDFVGRNDSGSASRFFYCAKPSKRERDGGLEGFDPKLVDTRSDTEKGMYANTGYSTPNKNHHPTVKPISLCEYLCTLTKTPTGGIVLDPFMGSGTTGCACVLTGRDFIGIEREDQYMKIAEARIQHYTKENIHRYSNLPFDIIFTADDIFEN